MSALGAPGQYVEGKRYELAALLCLRVSHYENDWGDTVWRYEWEGCNRERFVYSGKCLFVKERSYITVKATIKNVDTNWNKIRLARVKVVERLDAKPVSLI